MKLSHHYAGQKLSELPINVSRTLGLYLAMSKSKKKSKHRLRIKQWITDGRPYVICSRHKAIDSDHVPPKNIFLRPRPNNLVTVPACQNCNNNTSQIDEEFRAYLSLRVGIQSQESYDYWTKAALPTIQTNKRLKRQIIGSTKQVDFYSLHGSYVGKAHLALWEAEKHDLIIEKTVKGLYWEHYNEILGSEIKLDIGWLIGLNDEIKRIISQFHMKRIGDAFTYAYHRANDEPLVSAWLLEFYGTHLVHVITSSQGKI